MEKQYINTYKLLKSILVYNANNTSSKDSQIFKVVDIVLYYQLHSEQALLVVSSLGKQDLIYSCMWLKDHNSEMNWKKGKKGESCYKMIFYILH